MTSSPNIEPTASLIHMRSDLNVTSNVTCGPKGNLQLEEHLLWRKVTLLFLVRCPRLVCCRVTVLNLECRRTLSFSAKWISPSCAP